MFIADEELIGKREDYRQDSAVYEALSDEISKSIYEKRVELSCTGSKESLNDLIRLLPEAQSIIADKRKNDAYIFGCGDYGIAVKRLIKKNWIAFIDSNKSGQKVEGLPVLHPDDIKELYKDSLIYVTPKYQHEEIVRLLEARGVSQDRIVNVGEILMDMMKRQYFDVSALNLSTVDLFCDIGAYDGFNTKQFFRQCGNEKARALLLEPGKENERLIKKNLKKDEWGRCRLICKGASDVCIAKSYDNHGIWSSEEKIEFCTLDELLEDEKGKLYIKMDIEGAESRALKGAKKTICDKHPILAVSVYHRPQDIFELPRMILSMNPRYKFYLRHYTFREWDTVLYAVA